MIEVKIPTPGESISEVELSAWFVNDGDVVKKDQEIAEIESDKATLTLIASEGGKIEILVQEGETVAVGTAACKIDTSFGVSASISPVKPIEKAPEVAKEKNMPPVSGKAPDTEAKPSISDNYKNVKVSPIAKKMMEENHLSIDDVITGLHRLSKKDVQSVMGPSTREKTKPVSPLGTGARDEQRTKMSRLRKKISARLVSVKNETAMLTTFNEADMSAIIAIRKKYQEPFVAKHGIKLGFMSFFTKAVTEAVKLYPVINSMIDGEEMVTPNYMDVAVAVQTPKGLMAPVIRNAELMGFAEIEKKLAELAGKARDGRISLDEMTGGTFTITNGGVFGSLLSTPILNPPQSAILGMHNIVERPVAINGKVEICPMMYIALSYDHRIIDGKDSVEFLLTVKKMIEDPHELLFYGKNPDEVLL